jgi:predicted nuclease with TOPRIM domain
MSTPSDLNGIHRVRDEHGCTVAVVLANQAFEKLTAEAEQLRDEAARLRAQVEQLQSGLKAVTQERDDYLKSLHAITCKDWTFTAEEIADLDKNGVTLDEKFFEELEREFGFRGPSDGKGS